MKKREILWLVGTLLVGLVLNIVVFGINVFEASSPIDINVHDTYFIIEDWTLIFVPSILLIVVVYLIRTLVYKFKNLTANLILMISTVLLIQAISEINLMLNLLSLGSSDWTIVPPSSTDEIQSGMNSMKNSSKTLSRVLFFTQTILIIFLAFCAYKTGQNHKRTT